MDESASPVCLTRLGRRFVPLLPLYPLFSLGFTSALCFIITTQFVSTLDSVFGAFMQGSLLHRVIKALLGPGAVMVGGFCFVRDQSLHHSCRQE